MTGATQSDGPTLSAACSSPSDPANYKGKNTYSEEEKKTFLKVNGPETSTHILKLNLGQGF